MKKNTVYQIKLFLENLLKNILAGKSSILFLTSNITYIFYV